MRNIYSHSFFAHSSGHFNIWSTAELILNIALTPRQKAPWKKNIIQCKVLTVECAIYNVSESRVKFTLTGPATKQFEQFFKFFKEKKIFER